MSDDVLIWTALADSKRRRIVNLLEEKTRTTSEICEFFDVSRFAVMKHLKVLEQANLIKTKRVGRERWNFLNDDLVHFLRTKLTNDDADSPYRLVDILGLSPGRGPATPEISVPTESLHIEQGVLLRASAPQVFEALTTDIGTWWSLRVSADSQVFLEPYVNGRFYEAFNKAGQGILYATVTYIKQDEELRLRGTMELSERIADIPVPDNFVHAKLEKQDNGTQLSLNHRIVSATDETKRDLCKRRWRILLRQHLKPFVEKGIPYQHNP